jgi:oxygen-independent coproporphyrinogen III oxidase
MPASVYVHIPFCSHKCDFCDFTAFAGLDHLANDYVNALCKEIELRLSTHSNPETVSTVFYGGGTPGLIEPRMLEKIHNTLKHCLVLDDHCEVSIETTPDTITCSKLEQWHQIGINRLSIGVESLQDIELSAVGRGQSRSTALAGLKTAAKSCFKNISLDLMYGLPSQSIQSWDDSLQLALSFEFPHISAYGLTVAANSPLHKRFPDQSASYPGDEMQCQMYKILINRCESAGLRQYEISNFARPGYECRHNQTYWANEEYYAFGVGAHRYVGGVRSSNTRLFKQYLENCLTLETEEIIDPATAIKEGIFLALRTRVGLNFKEFNLRHGVDFKKQYAKTIEKLSQGGFIEICKENMRLSDEGVMVSNLVLSEFF